MDYCIMCIGKIKDSFYRERILNVSREINRRKNQIEIIEFADEKIPDRINEKRRNLILEKEGKRILEKIEKTDYVIALCIEGKEITTKQHINIVMDAAERGYGRITYLIGGSLGLSEAVKRAANQRISFSKMTFPHQLMRMVLCEEIQHITNYL